MADRQDPSRRTPDRRVSGTGDRRSTGDRQSPPPIRRSGAGEQRQNTNRRSDVVRCENCGEDYSITYKRCPFCDERPGRGGYGGGKRVSNTRGGGYGAPANPLRVAVLIISLALIIAAMFIVFRFFSSAIFGGKGGAGSSASGSGVSSSQVGSGSGQGSAGQPGAASSAPDSSTGSGSAAPPVQIAPQSISLNKYEMALNYNEIFQMKATVSPEGVSAPVTWSTSNSSALSIDENGAVKNLSTRTSTIKVIITATCGDVTAECIVYCKPQGGGTVPDPGTTTPVTPSGGDQTGSVAPNTKGKIVNAENGLNIRSGPGREHSVIASGSNGAEVTILGEENGWYHINYGGSNTGYVSKDYVSVG